MLLIEDPEWRKDRATKASREAHRPVTHARKLARDWPTMDRDERAEVLDALGPILVEATR